MDAGDYQGALEQFEAAYEFVPSPKILFNLGEAYFDLGRDAEALTSFDGFLDRALDAPAASRATATKRRDTLRGRLGFIETTSDPEGAAVSIDGRDVSLARPKGAFPVKPGQHRVAFKKEGFAIEERIISVGASQTVRISVKLTPPQTEPPAAIATAIRAPAETAVRGAEHEGGAKEVAAKEPRLARDSNDRGSHGPTQGGPPIRALAWVAGGVAALSLGSGLTFQLLSASKNRQFNNMLCNDNPSSAPSFGGPQCAGLISDADHDHRLAIIGFVAGGVLAVGSAVLFLLSAGGVEETHSGALVCGLAGGGAAAKIAAGCMLTF